MNNFVEVVYGRNGEAYLTLRKCIPEYDRPKTTEKEKTENSRVVIIDMYKEDRVCYAC